jgi:ribosome assembly protein 1
MWGSYYLNKKTKEFSVEPFNDNSKPLFVELALDNIFKIYKIILEDRDKDKVVQVAELFKLQIPNSDYSLMSKEPKNLLRTFMRQWLPIAFTVFELVINKLPDPLVKFSNQVERYFLNDSVNDSLTTKSNTQADEDKCSLSNSVNPHEKNYFMKYLDIQKIIY